MSKREVEDGELSDEDEPKAKRTKEYEDFVIDSGGIREADPEEENDNENEMNDSKSNWKDMMEKQLLGEKAVEEQKPRRNRNTCFNCGGDHLINACPEPRDFNRIRKAQLEKRLQQQNNTNKRYVDDSKQSNDSKFKAGRLSSKLREALNIGPDDIPEWIYRMRRMGFYKGYPPGYLKKAIKIDNSGDLLRFHTTSTNIVQVQRDASEFRPSPIVDSTKVIYYMGFNNSYRALKDLERFNVPPFEKFCEFLQEEVDDKHKRDEIIRVQEVEIAKRNKSKGDQNNELKNEKEIEDVMIIDRNGDSEDSEHKKEDENDETIDSSIIDDSLLGDSISLHIGTPVVSRRAADGSLIRQSLPDLEKFTVGIVPFEAKEEDVGEKGIFKRIMSKIKNFATGGSGGESTSKS
ncbi:unnamed protein product [Caenorhabditis angaria]|uniref:PSP proline-rich domain-containing protein n=1 Tax=Caenorhabditis angaria TaxID=860376 RepID=A0A9P1MWW0_9PELO|nr:unnamed protein product [Caenorhabditis angaria]